MVTHKGIEVSPDQIRAVNSLQPPQNPKEVQRLTGMITKPFYFLVGRQVQTLLPFVE